MYVSTDVRIPFFLNQKRSASRKSLGNANLKNFNYFWHGMLDIFHCDILSSPIDLREVQIKISYFCQGFLQNTGIQDF
jgi:hypothetical protein